MVKFWNEKHKINEKLQKKFELKEKRKRKFKGLNFSKFFKKMKEFLLKLYKLRMNS